MMKPETGQRLFDISEEHQRSRMAADQMRGFLSAFEGNPDRLAKYMELLLFGKNAGPLAFQPRGAMRRISIVLTTKCNLNCLWCHRREEAVQDYLGREMDPRRVMQLLPGLKGFNMLHWAGLGELFLYPALFEVTKAARQHFPVVKITTNGTLLPPATMDQLIASGCNYFEVSIDGFDTATNQKCRGADQNKIIAALKYLSQKSDIPIQINSALSELNYESLFEAVDQLKDVSNIVCLHTIPLFMTRYMAENDIRPVSAEAHARLLRHWQQRIHSLGLKFKLSPDVVGAVLDPVITLKRQHNICFCVYEDPFINVNGEIVPCGRLQHIGLQRIDTTENPVDGFDAAWNGAAFVRWRRNQLTGRYTADCQRECGMRCIVPGQGDTD